MKEPLGLKRRSPERCSRKRTRSVLPKPRRLLAIRTTWAQNIRMLLFQHAARNHATKSPLEGCRGLGRKKETGRRSGRASGSQAAKSGSGRNYGYRHCRPAVGRFRIGFLRGRKQPQPRTSTIICRLSKKRRNEEPSGGTPFKKPRTVPSGTCPVITMILHMGEKIHPISVLLDTGCSIALINQQTVEKLEIKKKEHRRPHSIENYTRESVKGAGQFYTEPMLLQHRKHYSRERFEISPMEPEIDAFLPFDWITAHPSQGAWTNEEIRFNGAECVG